MRVGIVSVPLTLVSDVVFATTGDIVNVYPDGLLVDMVTFRLDESKSVFSGFKFSDTVLEGMVTLRLGEMVTSPEIVLTVRVAEVEVGAIALVANNEIARNAKRQRTVLLL